MLVPFFITFFSPDLHSYSYIVFKVLLKIQQRTQEHRRIFLPTYKSKCLHYSVIVRKFLSCFTL